MKFLLLNRDHHMLTCVNVVLWRRLAGVGHETVVGVCPVC